MLFVLGGLVRSTGSGMGCPDWPKCFGEYIPPTSESELPENYKDYFKEQRIEKTERFAKLLTLLGQDSKAKELLHSDQISETHKFNTTKAYVEYVNRLWGALTGLIVFVTLILSFKYVKSNTPIFVLTVLGFIAVFVNALLGAVVVNSNLIGGIVTAHFLAAFAAISFFLLARIKLDGRSVDLSTHPKLQVLTVSLMLFILIQTVAGTQVREVYDSLQISSPMTHEQIASLGVPFLVHRSFGLIMLIVAFLQYNGFRKINLTIQKSKRNALIVLVLIAGQILFGSLLILTSFDAISKLFHISLGASIFVIQFYICSLILRAKKAVQ